MKEKWEWDEISGFQAGCVYVDNWMSKEKNKNMWLQVTDSIRELRIEEE